jgi:hypothetical protein
VSRVIEPAVPELAFAVRGIDPLEHAATPTLALHLDVAAKGDGRVRALTLRVEVRIALARRAHDPAVRERLAELFGTPAQWRSAPRALPWLDTTVTVPAFDGAASVTVPLPCTYDFDVTASKYFHALSDGVIPLDVLFSGTVFYAGADERLRTARLPWDREAAFELPVRVWKDLMAGYFPDTVWVRLDRESFDRLWAFKARHALPTWDDALDALLREPEASSPWTR